MENKRVLITGALGHIGSRLIREWPEEMLLLDNLSTQRYASLFDLKRDFKFVHEDILTANWDELLKGVYAVIHLAAATDAAESHRNREKYLKVNYLATKRLADACEQYGVRLFFPSTTSVYGSQESLVNEDSDLKPQCPYSEAKLMAENYLRSKKNLRFVICRFGTIYGWSIGMRFHTAVNLFTWQAINGRGLTVFKTAFEQKRPYLYLGDAIKAIRHVFYNDLFDQQVYNVLSGNHSVAELVNVLKQFRDVQVEFVDSPIMNQLSYETDGSKFEKAGFQPAGRLHEGMQETINHLWIL